MMKRESPESRKKIWLTGSILCFTGVFLLLFTGIAVVAFMELQNFPASLINRNATEDVLNVLWIVLFVSMILASAGLILSIVRCGKKLPDGSIDQSRWYDRIFPDVLIFAAIMMSCLSVPSGILFFDWLGRSALLNHLLESYLLLDPSQIQTVYQELQHRFISYSFEPLWVELVAAMMLWESTVIFDLYVIQSVAKRLKNRNFWRDTLIFQACCFFYVRVIRRVYRSIQKGRNLYVKTGLIFMGMIILSLLCAVFTGSFGFGYFALILLSGFVLFRILEKYQIIRNGIRELRDGNVNHQIPLTGDGELEQMAADLNAIAEAQKLAVARELKNERLKTDLISNVSHDLKTPLTSIVSYLDLLEKEGLHSASAPEYLEILKEKSARLQKLTEDLFEAAKASSGALPVNPEPVNLLSLVNQALVEVEDRLSGADLEILVKEKCEKSEVVADGRLLWRVLENLLVNVGKYALAGSRVYIDLLENRDMIRLEMKNISREPLNIEPEKLLERFQRGDTSRHTEGSGLGLSIARDLTGLMNGRFWIQIDGDLFKAVLELPACHDFSSIG